MGRGSGEPNKWWNMRTSMEKTLLSFSIILTITFLIVLIVGVTFRGNGGSENEEQYKLLPPCLTEDCLITAGQMLTMLNSTAQPCEDFYEFACGGYVNTHSIPLDYHEASVEHESADAVRLLLKQWLESTEGNNESICRNAKILYNTCMEPEKHNEWNIRIVRKILQDEKIGNWPILDPHWIESDVSIEERLATLTLLGVPIAFNLQVVPDQQNPGKSIVSILPGQPLLASYTEHQIRNDPLLSSYIETILLLLGVSKNRVSGDVEEILTAEVYFIKIKEAADSQCNFVNEGSANSELGMERMLFTEMDRRIHEIKWSELMKHIFNGIQNNQSRNSTSQININEADVYCRRYIREYVRYLEDQTPRVLYTYLGWRFLFAFVQHLGGTFHRLHSDYQMHMTNETRSHLSQPKWKQCLSVVERYMLPVLAKVYMNQSVPGALLKEKKKIASHVRTSLTDLLSETKWLKEQDKQKIKQKVSVSKFDIGLAKIASNWEHIDAWFSGLNLNPSSHLIENVLKMQRFEVTKQLKKLINPSEDILQWNNLTLLSSDVTTFNENSIAIHFDRIRIPYLRQQGPSYLNYGSFGSFLSRELLQYLAFQDFTTNVDSTRMHIFWELPKRNKDFSHCSGDSVLASGEINQNDEALLNSALTELGALHVAHLAYDSHRSEDNKFIGLNFNGDQMFFLAYAQALCEVRDKFEIQQPGQKLPSRIRVNFALRNFPSFGKTFECPADSPMNPSSKCHILD